MIIMSKKTYNHMKEQITSLQEKLNAADAKFTKLMDKDTKEVSRLEKELETLKTEKIAAAELLFTMPEEFLITIKNGKVIYGRIDKANKTTVATTVSIPHGDTFDHQVADYAFPVIRLFRYTKDNSHGEIGEVTYNAARKEWTEEWYCAREVGLEKDDEII